MKILPQKYTEMSRQELINHIADVKAKLGDKLCILGHHYQSDDTIQFADFRGDSLKLSQQAANQKTAEYIVFCGVHFMAESADVLSSPEQTVCIPNMRAGCGMADMADPDDVIAAIDEINRVAGGNVIPIAYVNSTAAIKAATAKAGGACCTSSNVKNVFAWAFTPTEEGGAGAEKIFALPDQHLARNTAIAMGYSKDHCVVYDPELPLGGLTEQQIADAKFILWKGWCYVHRMFQVEHVLAARQDHPDATVIVHPECPNEVVELADLSGSTSQIIETISAAPAGTTWVVGTESNMVRRLACQMPDKNIHVLCGHQAKCIQMARIDLAHLAWCLDSIAENNPVNIVTVDNAIAADSCVALERMINIKPVKSAQ